MWTLSLNDDGIVAHLGRKGRHIRTLKEAAFAALLLVVGFSIITLPDEILNQSDVISPLGRLAWHGFLGLLAGIIIVITRWDRPSGWFARPSGIWFDEQSVGSADIPADSIASVDLDNRPLRSRRLIVHTNDEKKVVLCRGFRSGQDPEEMLEKMQRWYR
jgi:hypothetical protein